jgi:hypothetical protein
MAQDDLDALLARMDAIAKAANAFSSETLQKEAFAAMIAAFEGRRLTAQQDPAPHVPPEPHRSEPVHPEATDTQQHIPAGEKAAKTKKPSKDVRFEWKMVKDLDLHPKGKPSFDEFVEDKKPSSNEDKYVVVVYYLKEILGTQSATIHQVGTVFRLMKTWKVPTDVANGLRVAAYRKGTLDTTNYEDIKLTPAGLNFVEHDLPPKLKGK